MSSPVICAVAVVSRSGSPLYFKSFGGGDTAGLQLSLFAALDVVSARLSRGASSSGGAGGGGATAATAGGRPAGDKFLGLLCPVEGAKVFGYVTPARTTLLLAVRDVLLLEERVRELFRALHRLYVDHAVCNPFASLDARVTSPAFEEAVYRLVDEADGTLEYRGPLPL